MDLTTTYNKLELNEYKNINEYFKDVLLVFSNARTFNEKDSELYNEANQVEDFFKLLTCNVKTQKK